MHARHSKDVTAGRYGADMADDHGLLTATQAAALVQVTASTVRRWRRAELLTPAGIRRGHRGPAADLFRPEDVIAVARNAEQAAGPTAPAVQDSPDSHNSSGPAAVAEPDRPPARTVPRAAAAPSRVSGSSNAEPTGAAQRAAAVAAVPGRPVGWATLEQAALALDLPVSTVATWRSSNLLFRTVKAAPGPQGGRPTTLYDLAEVAETKQLLQQNVNKHEFAIHMALRALDADQPHTARTLLRRAVEHDDNREN